VIWAQTPQTKRDGEEQWGGQGEREEREGGSFLVTPVWAGMCLGTAFLAGEEGRRGRQEARREGGRERGEGSKEGVQ